MCHAHLTPILNTRPITTESTTFFLGYYNATAHTRNNSMQCYGVFMIE